MPLVQGLEDCEFHLSSFFPICYKSFYFSAIVMNKSQQYLYCTEHTHYVTQKGEKIVRPSNSSLAGCRSSSSGYCLPRLCNIIQETDED
jgi:hypothetical protein